MEPNPDLDYVCITVSQRKWHVVNRWERGGAIFGSVWICGILSGIQTIICITKRIKSKHFL